jgi:hypothetical protein
MYKCGWNGCEKAYGTLNHLNAHVTMQSHGAKRTPEGKPFPSFSLFLSVKFVNWDNGFDRRQPVNAFAPRSLRLTGTPSTAKSDCGRWAASSIGAALASRRPLVAHLHGRPRQLGPGKQG